ncbi:hypothetical protein SLS63_002748 [Diaporthe eres]|uniref:Uncharacterized protein n=1 Tax=Diaporthe eres TaxID=83184 RepID=A0ABR1PII2_DIAER
MSSANNETMSSNESWKKAGGKTKHGRPTGRREVLEKYKAIGLESLNCGNRKQLGIEIRVFGYGSNRDAILLVPMLAKERRRANKLALQDQLLSLENDECREEAEHEAREECDEMMSETRREKDRELADRLGISESSFEDPWSLENIDWFGFDYGDRTDEFWDNYMGVIEWSHEQGTYVDFEQATWMAAPHFGEGCFVCKMMAKYGEKGPCR